MKTVVVTGATGNLGQAIVERFLREGYRVIGTVLKKEEITSRENYETELVNLMDEQDAAGFIDRVVDKYGEIDVAVLTVGGFAMGHIQDTSTEDIMKQYKLNFETAYNVARPVFTRMMQQNEGRIFIIGSRPGLNTRNAKGTVAYGLTKSLIFRLAELMNDEAKGRNVVTSVVVPSTIDTPQNRKSMPDADYSKWVTAEAIAGVIYFYCSNEGAVLREPVIKVYGNA